ncbi:MAG: hypothetical protein M1816_007147 [Peltula sp. TS41687]|nr:MAG: hypothetical protein M1816_007147 [Peltula sp. TS41687]
MTSASTSLPPNVHISRHPCVRAKLSQLRSAQTNGRDTKTLVHEIALLVGVEALRDNVQITDGEKDTTPLGYSYTTQTLLPRRISLIPILRSGLGMVEAIQTLLPHPIPVHHLGLFRDPISLQPVEYYNNLPYHHRRAQPAPDSTSTSTTNNNPSSSSASSTTLTTKQDEEQHHLAILVDPIIATGGTAVAAIQTLKEWGVTRIVVIAVLGSVQGLSRAAEECDGEGDGEGGGDGEIWCAGVDEEIDDRGMLRPGLGDVGDRLFLTVGK